jgi:microcystin-dependent protein
MKKLVIGIIFAVAACAALTGFAASAAFTYQGVIKEVGGAVPANKNRTIQFRIYDGPTVDTPLWGRAYNVLLDANGLFNTAITDAAGSEIDGVTSTGLAAILAQKSGTTLYIGLTVDGSSGEISPRQALLAVPYAIHASDAAAASGDFTVEGQTTLKGGLEVTGGQVTVPALSATSLSVTGNISAGTAGVFSGYGTIPVGGIIMWSGSANEVPDGWALCDGRTISGKTTPNLKGKFVVGYDPSDSDYNAVGKTGGYKNITLTVEQIPAHKHNNSVRTVGYAAAYNGSKEAATFDGNSKNNGHENIIGQDTGGGQPHENRPPYYAMCFIMRVK